MNKDVFDKYFTIWSQYLEQWASWLVQKTGAQKYVDQATEFLSKYIPQPPSAKKTPDDQEKKDTTQIANDTPTVPSTPPSNPIPATHQESTPTNESSLNKNGDHQGNVHFDTPQQESSPSQGSPIPPAPPTPPIMQQPPQ